MPVRHSPTADYLRTAGWTTRPGHECDAELARGGMCARPGHWIDPQHPHGRPWCTRHAYSVERERRRIERNRAEEVTN